MPGVKGRSGGARRGAGRKPSAARKTCPSCSPFRHVLASLQDESKPLAVRIRHAQLIATLQTLDVLHQAALRGSVTACIALLRQVGHFHRRVRRPN